MAPQILDFLSRHVPGVAQRRISSSAMTPFIFICGLSTPFLGVACYFHDSPLVVAFLLIVGSIPFLTATGVGIYFAIKEPDRLHSEEYRLKTRALEITEHKGGKFKVDPVNLVDMTNPFPEPKQISHDQQDHHVDEKDEPLAGPPGEVDSNG